MIDVHAHFAEEGYTFPEEWDKIRAAGVRTVILAGDNAAHSRMHRDFCRDHDGAYFCAGIHPLEANAHGAVSLEPLRELLADERCVALGEIGLDYYWPENPPKELQKRVFRAQLALAGELDLPAIVHDREAHGDCLDIVREFPRTRGVFHCFSGSAEMAMELVKLGWMISFTGVLTYKNARKAVEAAQAVPLDRIMIETDSPYMAPVPHRGKRNHSGYVGLICQRLAELKGITPDECSRITLENGRRFFQILE